MKKVYEKGSLSTTFIRIKIQETGEKIWKNQKKIVTHRSCALQPKNLSLDHEKVVTEFR